MQKCATREGTAHYRDRFKNILSQDHFNNSQNLFISSIGFGSYLGKHDDATDLAYADSLIRAIEFGCNFIDTAINYRFQRSERAIGAALKTLFQDEKFSRDELVIATKGGYIPFDDEPPRDIRKYFIETFVETGIATPEDIVSGIHCMTPRYIENQIESSLKNLGIECIDIYYIHNPEEQFREVSRDEFNKRIRGVYELLEKKVAEGKIGVYGVATWNGLRQEVKTKGYLSIEELFKIARVVGGDDHHFRVIQLPFNLAMPEALVIRNQILDGEELTTLEAANNLGITVVASSSLLQNQLSRDLPDFLSKYLKDLKTDAQLAIQFVRSVPGITSALVGMSTIKHVEENMGVASIPRATLEDLQNLFKYSEK